MGLAGLEDHFHRAHFQWWGDMTPVWPLSVKGSDFRYLEQGYEREYKGVKTCDNSRIDTDLPNLGRGPHNGRKSLILAP